MNFNEYKKQIKEAASKKELTEITYRAFLEDDNALTGKNSLYNKVIRLAVTREMELGLD